MSFDSDKRIPAPRSGSIAIGAVLALFVIVDLAVCAVYVLGLPN